MMASDIAFTTERGISILAMRHNFNYYLLEAVSFRLLLSCKAVY